MSQSDCEGEGDERAYFTAGIYDYCMRASLLLQKAQAYEWKDRKRGNIDIRGNAEAHQPRPRSSGRPARKNGQTPRSRPTRTSGGGYWSSDLTLHFAFVLYFVLGFSFYSLSFLSLGFGVQIQFGFGAGGMYVGSSTVSNPKTKTQRNPTFERTHPFWSWFWFYLFCGVSAGGVDKGSAA